MKITPADTKTIQAADTIIIQIQVQDREAGIMVQGPAIRIQVQGLMVHTIVQDQAPAIIAGISR